MSIISFRFRIRRSSCLPAVPPVGRPPFRQFRAISSHLSRYYKKTSVIPVAFWKSVACVIWASKVRRTTIPKISRLTGSSSTRLPRFRQRNTQEQTFGLCEGVKMSRKTLTFWIYSNACVIRPSCLLWSLRWLEGLGATTASGSNRPGFSLCVFRSFAATCIKVGTIHL